MPTLSARTLRRGEWQRVVRAPSTSYLEKMPDRLQASATIRHCGHPACSIEKALVLVCDLLW